MKLISIFSVWRGIEMTEKNQEENLTEILFKNNLNTNALVVRGWVRGWCTSFRPHIFLQLTHVEIFNDDSAVFSPPLDIPP